MQTIEHTMNLYIQKEKGNVLAICPTEGMIQTLQNNEGITVCDVLSKNQDGKKGKTGRRQKHFSFKKMRKKFKKKTKDVIIADIKELESYWKTFIRDSIYITKGTIYLFVMNPEYDLDLLIKRYHRFQVGSSIKKCKDGVIVTIHVGNAKNHFWKEKMYYIIDVLTDIADLIGDALVS